MWRGRPRPRLGQERDALQNLQTGLAVGTQNTLNASPTFRGRGARATRINHYLATTFSISARS